MSPADTSGDSPSGDPQRTSGDEQEDATNDGVSTQEPAEGGDDAPGRSDGSPQG